VARGGDASSFKCLGCGCGVQNISALRHFQRFHKDLAVAATDWVVVKDGNALRSGWTRTHLESYFIEQGEPAGAVAVEPGADGSPVDAEDEALQLLLQLNAGSQGCGAARDAVVKPPAEQPATTEKTLISMPGASFTAMVLVPQSVASDLLACGFIEELTDGRLHWNQVVPVDMQQAQLLDLLPEGPQKRLLEKKFGAAPGVASQPRVQPSQAMTLRSSLGGLPTASSLPAPLLIPTAATLRSPLGRLPAAYPLPAPLLIPEAPGATDLALMLGELKEFMRSHASGAPRVEVQPLEIDAEFASWVVPEEWKGKHRNNFPFTDVPHHDEEFDKFMAVRRLSLHTRNKYMKGLARVIMMVGPTDGSDLDCPNMLVNVFRSGLFQKLQELPILSDGYSCTRHTVVALGHFAVMSKLRYQAAGDANGAQMIDQVISGHLTPWSKRCSAAEKASANRKYVEDALLIAKYHTPEALKRVAYSQYLDLITIHRAVCVEKSNKLTPTMLFKATACVITAQYTNAPPGRSMELETLPRQVVDDFLATEGLEWFPYSNYKTFKVYGAGGKWVNAANRQAFVLYRDILDTARDLFVDVAADEAFCFFQKQTVSVHSCLKSVSVAEKLEPHLKVNLMRKAYAVWAKLHKTTEHKGEDAEDLFAKVARMDKHRASTADQIYAAITPEEDARLAKHCFLRLMGEPVSFPSFDTWEKDGRSLEDIMARLSRYDNSSADGEQEEDKDFDELVGDADEDASDEWADVLEADSIQPDDPRNAARPKLAAKATRKRKHAKVEPCSDNTPTAIATQPDAPTEDGADDGGEARDASDAPPASDPARAYVYNAKQGKFEAKETLTPNILVHEPPRTFKQTHLTDFMVDAGTCDAEAEQELEALLDKHCQELSSKGDSMCANNPPSDQSKGSTRRLSGGDVLKSEPLTHDDVKDKKATRSRKQPKKEPCGEDEPPAPMIGARTSDGAEPASGAEPARGGRRSSFNATEIEWIVERRTLWGVHGPGTVDMSGIKVMLQEGLEGGHLRAGATVEKIRHVCRTAP